jgi:uncharacterized membrane protein YeiB
LIFPVGVIHGFMIWLGDALNPIRTLVLSISTGCFQVI